VTDRTWIWGRRPVLEAIGAGTVERVLVSQSVEASFRSSLDEATRATRVTIEVVDRTRLDSIVPSGKSQGVVASVRRIRTGDVSEILAAVAASDEPALILVLEEIQDPGNVGALIRSADGAGCHGVIVSDRRSAPLSGIASKASAGAVHHMSIAQATNMSHVIGQLRDAGIWTVGLADSARETIYDCDLTAPTAILVGGEGTGLRRLTAERVDRVASIPMRGRVGSLNASVAGAVALFEAVRQRRV